MDKAVKNEVLFTKLIMVFYILSIGSTIFVGKAMDLVINYTLLCSVALFFVLLSLLKLYLNKKYNSLENKLYSLIRIIEIITLIVISKVDFLNIWAYFSLIILISVTSLNIDFRKSIILAMSASILSLFLTIIVYNVFLNKLLIGVYLYNLLYIDIAFAATVLIITTFTGMLQKQNNLTQIQNKMLVKEIEEKYDMLAVAQQEIKNHYDKLKYTNKKLEESNLKLSSSIGEFYTLHQISTAISSILNIKELLRYVNDIMIGVMGVQYSSIALYDDKNENLKVYTTNIKNSDILFSLSSNINCQEILETLEQGKPLINNYVKHEYPFTSGREVNSIICAPLISKTRKIGVVLIEHKLNNAFSEDKIRLLEIICQQVSIAMENAELYQKMHELAITDWLTGVYNRVYFDDILFTELNNAKENNYQFCVGIFDIDLFKRINDTYGHVFGDEVIKTIAETAREALDYTDSIARYGGEEFVVLMPETSMNEAYKKLENLRAKIENTIIREDNDSVSVTASFGFAGYPVNSLTGKELLKHADAALYEAKNSGRNCVKAYDKSIVN